MTGSRKAFGTARSRQGRQATAESGEEESFEMQSKGWGKGMLVKITLLLWKSLGLPFTLILCYKPCIRDEIPDGPLHK